MSETRCSWCSGLRAALQPLCPECGGTGWKDAPVETRSLSLRDYVEHKHGCRALQCPFDGKGTRAVTDCSCGLDDALRAQEAIHPPIIQGTMTVPANEVSEVWELRREVERLTAKLGAQEPV